MEPLQHATSTPAVSILVAEDDKPAREALCLMLRMKFPHAVVYSAENGRDGLDIFRRHMPDIVITDVNMPEMNGIEMAEAIKSVKPGTQFIVLTAYNEKIFFQKFSEIGFSAYILKPIEFRKLFTALEQCIAGIPPNP